MVFRRALCAALMACALPAFGAVTTTPASVSGFPGQTTSLIRVDMTFPVPSNGGPGTLVDTGTPAGTTTVPAPITYSTVRGDTAGTTTFQFAIGGSTLPGTYNVTLRDATNGAGSATVTLIVANPSITFTASPNPVTLVIGGGGQPVTVTTRTDPGFSARDITYTFSGFPAFINTGSPQVTTGPNYPPATFNFSLGAGAAGGTYPGTLTGTYTDPLGVPQSRSIAFTVIVQQPDIGASFSNPSVNLCDGGSAVANSIDLTPLSGYSGTPQLNFTSVPAGIIVSPTSPPANRMPPSQSVPFTIRANGAAPGTQTVILNISDPAANINKNIALLVNVTAPDYTPSVSPTTVNLVAGGGGQSMTASITPNSCFTAATVTVTPSGQPLGITFNPPNATLSAPGYFPANFLVQAASSVAPGTYPVTFTFTPSSGPTKTVTVTMNVSAGPDFRLTVTPSAVSVAPGQSTSVNVSATGINGFTGTITVNAPSNPSATFTPSTFTLTPGTSQVVNILAAAGAQPTTFTGAFTGTAGGVSRSANVTVTITPGPDFTLSVAPPSLSLASGQSGTVNVSVTGLNGFTGGVNVTVPDTADLRFTPSAFVIPAGGSQPVVVTVSNSAPLTTFTATFTGTAAGVTGSRTANLILNIIATPDFTLEVMPPALTIAQGGTATVSVSATGLNGFNGPVTVTSLPTPGVTVTPATFMLNPGTPQTVTVTVTTTAQTGTADVRFIGTAPGVIGTRTASLAISVGGRPDFALAVTPASISIPSRDSGTAVVSVIGSNGFSGPVTILASAPAPITVTPASFTLAPGATQSVRIDVGAATVGPVTIRFTGTAAGITHTTDLLLNVLPRRPVITSIASPSVATGSRSVVLRLSGNFFQPGARVTVANSAVRIENVSVINAQLADVTVSVRADGAPGATTVTLTNPDGGSASGTLLVYPFGSIAAPLGVTTAAIVFPPAGTMIAPEQKVFPRGLLATTGTGTIIGSWKFDGTPFDRFIVTVGGGYPAEVRTHVPIPISYAGGHTLTLEIETPQYAVSPSLNVLMAAASVSRLTLLAPRDGAVILGQSLFRWSLVPNTSGYLLEIDNPSPSGEGVRMRLAEAEWMADRGTLQQLAPGIHRWRVRPVFPGETEGEPTEWQRFAILPASVSLRLEQPVIDSATRRMRVRWGGGIPGLLYRVEFVDPSGRAIFSALTAANEYVVPIAIPPGTSLRVTAFGPGGVTLGVSPSLTVASHRARAQEVFLAQQPPSIRKQEPANGSKVTNTQPRIAVEWSGSVRPEDVSLMIDQTDVTAVSTITSGSISYDSLLPLATGPHTVRLSLNGELTTWTFEVAETAAPQPAAPGIPKEPAKAAPSALKKDWAVTPIGTLTVIGGNEPDEKDTARLQLSSQTDLTAANNGAKVTADVAMKHDFNAPRQTIQESRNWLTQFTRQHGAYQGEAKIGYAAPDFLDQSELLSTGLARGAVEGRVHFPLVIVSGYETFGTRPGGVVAGNFGPQQNVRAASLQTAANPKWDFRLTGFRVKDEPGFNSAGGRGKAVGIFGKYVVSPMLTMLLETARGSFTPNLGSAETKREGSATRLSLNGVRGTLTYDFSLRRTAADFVNPANRGFTPGGVPDRTGANLSISKVISRTSISLQLRTLRDGNSSGAILPKNRETGGSISLATSIGSRTTLSLATNWTGDRGNAIPNLLLPKLDRNQSGVNGTLAENIGWFNLSQTLTMQRLRDRVNPISDQTISGATFSFGGAVNPIVNLNAVLSGTRMKGSPEVGTTDQLLASLQPTFTLATIGITFQPRAMYSSSKSDLTNFETRSEQYQGLVTWAPAWHQSAFSIQLSADANRNHSSGQVTPSKFIHRYVSTLSLRWGAGNGASMNGTTVVNAPADVATTQPTDPSTTSSISH